MAIPSTNQEWRSVIDEVAAEVDAAQPTIPIPASSLTAKSLAKTIDHTLLKLDATEDQVTQLCKEAVEYDFAVLSPTLSIPPNKADQSPRLSACASTS
jgi:deoxyribose-phosphate aldolase